MKYVIFDLDDTLIYEIDYLKSAYYSIARSLGNEDLFDVMFMKYRNRENVFEYLSAQYDVEVDFLIDVYRKHFPELQLVSGAKDVLEFCHNNTYKIGLISDGRSITQRNKLKAVGIEHLFHKIVISEEIGSEKPNENNFLVFMDDSNAEYIYVADNFKKDFVTPNRLGWKTIALLDAGHNIHKQEKNMQNEYNPHYEIFSLHEIINILVSI